ncbi:MAG: hypothetical protein ACNA7J_06630 [Wenzhouxiangella sp.]
MFALPRINSIRITFTLVLVATMTACDPGPHDEETSVHSLRIHDVSGLQIEGLDLKLNDLLGRADLPLRGQVELLDDFRLAVNGSEHLQKQIERILGELGALEAPDAITPEREARLQFWILSLSEAVPHAALPASLQNIDDIVTSEFPGLNLNIEDFGEFFQWPNSTSSFRSGTGTHIFIRPFQTTEEGAHIHATIQLAGPLGGNRYEINRKFVPEQALILGRSRVGRDSEPFYQVLVARLDWAD